MKTISTLKRVLLIVMTFALVSFTVPTGWIKKVASEDSYDAGIDQGAGQNGVNAATIKSLDHAFGDDGYGNLAQNIHPGKYLGKKIKFSGYVKTEDVSGWAMLWMRVDQPTKSTLENMKDRFLKGTTGWTKCEIVLEVPKDTKNIAFGGVLSGTGQMWFDSLKIEVAKSSDKVTGKLEVKESEYTERTQQPEPVNLDFSK